MSTAAKTCPCCGAAEVKTQREERTVAAPLGPEVGYVAVVDTCRTCGESGDFDVVNDTPVEEALATSRNAFVRQALDELESVGLRRPCIERVLSLPQGALTRWARDGASPEGAALFRFLKTFPWLLDVADAGFTPEAAELAVTRAAQRAAPEKFVTCRHEDVEWCSGRWREAAGHPIPADLKLPTCVSCGEWLLTRESAPLLDAALGWPEKRDKAVAQKAGQQAHAELVAETCRLERKAKLVAAREHLRRHIEARKAKGRAPNPPPRYDEVFFEGMAASADAPLLEGATMTVERNWEHVVFYKYSVQWSEEDQTFVGRCAEFELLSADGPSPAAALTAIIEVVDTALADLKSNGEHVPPPLSKPL